MSIKRRTAREKVLQALYARELSGNPLETILQETMEPLAQDEKTHLYALALARYADTEAEQIDKRVKPHLANWEYSRLAIIDKILIRMGICEFIYFEDIPPKVTINEMIEIARRYSTDQSDKFVNGILDAILTDLKKDGELHKSGRGLVELSVAKKGKKKRR